MNKTELTITVEEETTNSKIILYSTKDAVYLMAAMIKNLNQLADEILKDEE